jgi:hypothetical protein
MNARIALVLFILPVTASAQAAVEAAAGTARAVTTTAPAQKVGQGIAGAFDKLNRTLESAGQQRSAAPAPAPVTRHPQAAAVAQKAPPKSEPKPEVVYEDPSKVEQGMDSSEVVSRFGPPSLKMTTGPEQETLCYLTKDGVSVDVTVRSGKVTAIQKAGKNSLPE